MIENVKAILIDIDNTLLDFNKGSKIAMAKAFNECGIEFKDGYFDVFTRENDLLWEKIERGELTRLGLHKVRFYIIFDALGIKGDGDKAEIEFRKALFNVAEKVDGANELLEYLSKKYTLYCASNAIYNQQINRLKIAKMHDYFDGFFISETIGVQKPTKEFFDYCFKNMNGITKEQTIMIGDSLTADIIGAKNYGIKSIWYNHLKRENKTEILPDYEVASLLEIKNII